MPSAEHSKVVHAPFGDVWAFVSEMDNWAPLVTGYERHEKLSDSESIWFLKGELGGLTRVAEFKVHIDEWDNSGRVLFSLQGVNEPVTGSGRFHAEAISGETQAPVPPPRPGFLLRLRDAIVRLLFARVFSQQQRPATGVHAQPTRGGQCQLTFALTLTAGGSAGMVLNMLLTPMMKPVAEDLADKLAARIEGG